MKLRVLSRHPSHKPIKGAITTKVPGVVRLGSTTELAPKDAAIGRKYTFEINSTGAVKISANKLLMKHKFLEGGVQTADWWTGNGESFYNNDDKSKSCTNNDLPYPIVAKHLHGSRGRGNYLLRTKEEFTNWMSGKDMSNYIFERYYNYAREYRLHVTKDKCFYTCRKMIKEGTPTDKRWYRNDSNCVWIMEENPSFNKPENWNQIIQQSILALTSVGLDIGAIDVKVQAQENTNPHFIILETNSAPSFGDVTLQKYTQVLTELINSKNG